MKIGLKWKIVSSLAVLLLLLGFFPALQSSNPSIRTEMACPCSFGNDTVDGENPCNYITSVDYIYRTGVLNIYHRNQSRQIIMCENGEKVGERINQSRNSGYRIGSVFLDKTYSLG